MKVNQHNKVSKINKLGKGLVLGAVAAMSLTACGDLQGLLSSPEVRATIQSFMELYLGQEVDGQTRPVQSSDIKAIRADGKPLKYEVGAEGQIRFQDMPPQASTLEVEYSNGAEPVVMPIQAEQKMDGKLVMRGVTRFKRAEGGLRLDGHFAGFDFDHDGHFDAQRPQFVHQQGMLTIHDARQREVRRFEAGAEGRFDLGRPLVVARGEAFFLPPRPPMPRPQPGPINPGPQPPAPQQPAPNAAQVTAESESEAKLLL